MKAQLVIPLTKTQAIKAIKALGEQPDSARVTSSLKATSKGLEINIKAKDVTSMRAAMNTLLKLYKVHEQVMINAQNK